MPAPRQFRVRRISELSYRDFALIAIPALIVAVIGVWIAAKFIKPAPPTHVVMATGVKSGGYDEYGQRYQKILARQGITLELRPTEGSVDNYNLLKNSASGVDIALVQTGIGTAGDAPGLVSLGSMTYEPLWVFCQSKDKIERIAQLRGKRLAIGPPGSGTQKLVLGILDDNGLNNETISAIHVTGLDGAEALLAGAIDCLFVIAAPDAGIVRALSHAPTLSLMNFARADAYVRRLHYLTKLTLPEGVLNMDADIPAQDVNMLAATAELVVREDLHPAIQMLLLLAASEVHSGGSLFNREGDFPSERRFDFPISPDASRFYKSGRPFLQRYLPFWLANLFDRLIVLAIPLIAVLFPLFRLVPPLYRWRVRSRIYRWYGELMFIETEAQHGLTAGEVKDYTERLDWIEKAVNELHPPLSYADQLYALRQHIDYVRAKLAGGRRVTSSLAAAPEPAGR